MGVFFTISQGIVREKSGDFDLRIRYEPCAIKWTNIRVSYMHVSERDFIGGGGENWLMQSF